MMELERNDRESDSLGTMKKTKSSDVGDGGWFEE